MAKTVHGYLYSADISTAGEIVLYDENGATVTVGPTDRLEIYSVGYAFGPGVPGTTEVKIFADANNDNVADAAEVVASYRLNAAQCSGASQVLGVPFLSPLGAKPHAIGSAAVVATITLTGVVRSYNVT